AAKRLVKSLQEDPHFVDCAIYPLVLLYRHGIELSLKHLAPLVLYLSDETGKVAATHKLMDNWSLVRRCLVKLDEDEAELTRIEGKLKELVEIDPNGETFRYPEARDTTPHLQDTSLINVEVFAEEMDALALYFEGSCLWASEMCDRIAEGE